MRMLEQAGINNKEDKELEEFAEEAKASAVNTTPSNIPKNTNAAPKAEELAERYKKILLELGFHKKQNGDDKEQYVKKEEELVIGCTFTESLKTGKLWAFKGKNFLEPGDVKKLKIVQAFYNVREGNKTIETVTGELGIKKDEKIVPFSKNSEIERKMGTKRWEKKGGYYHMRGHDEADAWLVQQWGNEMGVSTKIITAEQDEKGVKVIVRAEKDEQFVDAVVIHDFKTSSEVITFETIENMERERKNAIEGYDDVGRPILVSEARYRMYKRFIKFKNFAARDAATKAGRIATLKIMNRDWRDAEEIESEGAEVRSVNEGYGGKN